jgi:hypothetical protein
MDSLFSKTIVLMALACVVQGARIKKNAQDLNIKKVATAAESDVAKASWTCHGVNRRASDSWCNNNCNHVPSHCPPTHCRCNKARYGWNNRGNNNGWNNHGNTNGWNNRGNNNGWNVKKNLNTLNNLFSGKKHEVCCMCEKKVGWGKTEWFAGEDYTVGQNAQGRCNRECATQCRNKGAQFAGCWRERRMKKLRRQSRSHPLWTIKGMPDDWFGDHPNDIC